MNAPKRRWFRFSLRTLFVVMTLWCVWLGYHLNWIRQRQAFITEQTALLPTGAAATGGGIESPPGVLSLFRERGYQCVTVVVSEDTTARFNERDWAMIDRARKLFPEAKIMYADVDQDEGLKRWPALTEPPNSLLGHHPKS